KDLFLDTGIGEEGYSIMEQGRVEYILSARPEDRRELFEEAAGVSKYKARRDEALRKMERTQMDLDRLSDVIVMTKEQMDKIESAVRKARQYQKLQEDLKGMEITHWLYEIAQLEGQMSSMKEAIHMMECDLQVRTTQINQSEAQLTELRWQETQQGERLVESHRQLSDMDGAINLAEQKQTTAREREDEIHKRDQVLDSELDQGRTRTEELSQMRSDLKGVLDLELQSAQESAALLQNAESHHAAQAALLKELEGKAKSLQDALWQIAQDRSHMHNEVAVQRSLETRLEMEMSVQQKDKAKTGEKIQAGETELQKSQGEWETWQNDLRQIEDRAQTLRGALQNADAHLLELSRRHEELHGRFYQVKAQLDAQAQWETTDLYAQGVQTVMSAGLSGIQGPLGRLITVDAHDESIVRQVLGGHLNDLVADTLQDAQAAIEFLTSQNRGRARILVLDRIPRIDRQDLLASVGQRPILTFASTEPKYEPVLHFLLGKWMVSGTTLYGEGIVEGGVDVSSSAAFDPLRRENLQKEMTAIESDLQALSLQRNEEEQKRQALTAEWEVLRQSLESTRAKGTFLRHEIERHKTQLSLAQDEIKLIDDDMTRLRQEEQQAEETARSIETRMESLKVDEDRLRVDWQSLQESLQKQQGAASAASTELAVVKERANSHQERLHWRQKQMSDVETELANLAVSLETKAQERSSSQERIEEQLRIQEECRRGIADLLIKRQKVSEDLEAVHSQRQTLHNQISDVQKALTESRERAEEMKTQLQDKHLQLSHAQFRRESHETQLREKYTLTLDEARQGHVPPAQPIAVADLEKLRRRVENIGPVNLAAPEEHAQLEERYNFLLSQQQDLLKAKEDLMQTIHKINIATRQNFRETFDKVRENFKALYGQLFQGGEADIRLTDESDLLNTGVDIFAQPPGKKLQNIALLSGGEKALTAIALLFAFFMVRPAPFAVMDEVDAPLDEANVTRFVSLIQAFTSQSQ
ncbi:MAG: hypothetical protein HY548_07370, partial [Elusimicrobia bacterium]|nr:hypothetical protein [Elusimicrobiota bacterium]